MKKIPLADRFDRHFIPEPNSGCWIWIGKILPNGYGTISASYSKGEARRCLLAHRASYEIYRSPIPHGMIILHECDTRCCVNPDHLRIGTFADNTADMDKKGRRNSSRTHLVGLGKWRHTAKDECSRGHPLSGDNLMISAGRRYCRECLRRRGREKYAKSKAKAGEQIVACATHKFETAA